MTHWIRKSWSLALAAVVALAYTLSDAAAEPVIVAPQEPVPIGGFADVEISGMAKPETLDWDTVPPTRVRVSAKWGKPDVAILSIESTKSGTWSIWVACIEGDRIFKKVIPVTIGPPIPPPPVDPPNPNDPPPPTTKTTAVTFVYEKDQHAIPSPVLAALNRLNRERGVMATVLEADTTDGTGDVPEQYRAALAAAKDAGLPCLIVTGESGVIRVVKDPKTEEAVMEAVPAVPAMRRAG